MDDIDFEILRFLEKEGPKTTLQISEFIRKSKHTTERRLLRLKPRVRELQSKIRGPSIWWFPSLYEYMCKVARIRLESMGYLIKKRDGLDFYGESRNKIGGICTDVLNEEQILHEYSKFDDLDRFILMTTRDINIDKIEVWNLMDVPHKGIRFIPISKEINEKLLDRYKKGDFRKFCSKIVEKGLEIEEWL